MKNDTSTYNLDEMLAPKQQEQTQVIEQPVAVQVDWDEVLTEWSYRLPKGYPTVVDGVFIEREEVEILNEILQDKFAVQLPFEESLQEAITVSQLSSNPTDVKEAMVCLFADAILSDSSILENYRASLDKKLDDKVRKKLAGTVKNQLTKIVRAYGKNYGITGHAKMADFVAQAMSDPKLYRGDVVLINNGVGAADTIVSTFSSKIKPGMVRRDEAFNAIRAHAVDLIAQNYSIKNYFPDNWCPGDVYFFLNNKALSAINATTLNIGDKSLNNYFYGTSNAKGSIIAVSLKMQEAQAGKGTTFIKNVVVDGVSPKDKIGKDTGNQLVIKFRDVRRRMDKYYFSDDWKKDPNALPKIKSAVAFIAKQVGLSNVPLKPKEAKQFVVYLNKNKNTLQKAVSAISDKLGKTVDTAGTFQQAYSRFVKNLKALNIDKVEGDSREFVKKVEEKNKQDNKGKLDQAKMQELLSQKAATYDLASVLIEKWTEKTKKLSPAFEEYLKKVKNPFVAITMFAIAQHGLNPNFFKAIGTNNASTGQISEFPSNSVVDEKKSVQKLKVVDSPGQAGFYIEYLLNINNHAYKTTLVFRFSKDQIRVEVEELTQV